MQFIVSAIKFLNGKRMKRIVIDLDNTLTIESDLPYEYKDANRDVVEMCKSYKKKGFEIVIFTARNMKTFKCNVGKITAVTLPIIIEWLEKNKVPYDEVFVGKPWCGEDGFYVDDKAIRPDEFARLTYDEIRDLIG